MAVTQIDGGRQVKAGTITNAEIASGAAIDHQARAYRVAKSSV